MTTPEPQDNTENVDSTLPKDTAKAERTARTRTQATYIGWVVGILVMILLLIFILQNLDSQEISFLNLTANVPVGVSLLIAAIAGALITAALSGARMLQIKRSQKKASD